jgi:flagellar protein FlaG
MDFDSLSILNGTEYTPSLELKAAPAPRLEAPEPRQPAQPVQPDLGPVSFSGAPKGGRHGEDGDFKIATHNRVVSEADIAREVAEANQKLREMFREFHYSVHKATNSVVVKIINSGTQEVLREIPPEKSLDALAQMWELHGLFVDKKL